jgi:hypothetical protein
LVGIVSRGRRRPRQDRGGGGLQSAPLIDADCGADIGWWPGGRNRTTDTRIFRRAGSRSRAIAETLSTCFSSIRGRRMPVRHQWTGALVVVLGVIPRANTQWPYKQGT